MSVYAIKFYQSTPVDSYVGRGGYHPWLTHQAIVRKTIAGRLKPRCRAGRRGHRAIIQLKPGYQPSRWWKFHPRGRYLKSNAPRVANTLIDW